MRLGDLDALYDCVEARYRQSSGEEHKAERALLDAICDSSTIDAIPVEWLQERKNWAAIDGDYWSENIIGKLLEAWQKEQEAQDG